GTTVEFTHKARIARQAPGRGIADFDVMAREPEDGEGLADGGGRALGDQDAERFCGFGHDLAVGRRYASAFNASSRTNIPSRRCGCVSCRAAVTLSAQVAASARHEITDAHDPSSARGCG